LFALGILIISASTACAVSYEDADGDSICEPGEEITFYGDPHFDYYDWDFDGDGLPDDNGQVVTYVFDEEGIYTVTVVETNGHTEKKTLIIEVKTDEEPDPEPQDKEDIKMENKIRKILDRLYRNNVKIDLIVKLVMKEYYKFQRKYDDGFDLEKTLEKIEA
jgi:hypothetical protein